MPTLASRVRSPRSYVYRPPKVKTWTVDGWTGMYDSRADVQQPDEAPLLVNLMPTDTTRSGPVALRPGLKRLTTPTTTQITGAVKPQWMGSFTRSNGAYLVVIIAGGEIYTLDLSTGTLTRVVTAANLTTGGITLSATNAVYCVEFNQTLVVGDTAGNLPFTWDGTTGAGGLTKLTNAPASRTGAPTVYYAKLFFIKGDLKTIVWSEENQANTGYEAAGYNNAWALTQTSSTPLAMLLGTNEGLYYFRQSSVGVIRGAVSSTFQNDGVHDAVARGIGCLTSAVPLLFDDAVWWISGQGRPMVYRPGGDPIDLTDALPRRYGTAQGSSTPEITAYGSVGEHLLANAVPFTHVIGDAASRRVRFEGIYSTTNRISLVCDAEHSRPLTYLLYQATNVPGTVGMWSAVVHESVSVPTGWTVLYGDTSGYLFKEPAGATGTPSAIGFDEVHNGAGAAITGTLIGPMHGHTHRGEWQFDQLDVLADAQPSNTLTVGYITSRFHKASLTPADQTVSDSSVTNTPYERHKAFGLGKDASGRWLRPIISVEGKSTANQLPQIHGYELTGSLVSSTPASL